MFCKFGAVCLRKPGGEYWWSWGSLDSTVAPLDLHFLPSQSAYYQDKLPVWQSSWIFTSEALKCLSLASSRLLLAQLSQLLPCSMGACWSDSGVSCAWAMEESYCKTPFVHVSTMWHGAGWSVSVSNQFHSSFLSNTGFLFPLFFLFSTGCDRRKITPATPKGTCAWPLSWSLGSWHLGACKAIAHNLVNCCCWLTRLACQGDYFSDPQGWVLWSLLGLSPTEGTIWGGIVGEDTRGQAYGREGFLFAGHLTNGMGFLRWEWIEFYKGREGFKTRKEMYAGGDEAGRGKWQCAQPALLLDTWSWSAKPLTPC